ncbi:hypothetical protein P280DRAFT_485276 [Massarina eburnea CBS 473.64]|uniref:C3H1-type domain-containing protein n=1 Tax=Massarina eburnea CBS 473.64 TaxID=1395130 RepID=A0A6A6RJP5_9PLEO|nr:hypothetical protein P280DRAFT_485276 [Massarina eburnea CBS 473.64]
MYPTRLWRAPPYTVEQIASLSTSDERFKAEASLRSYICGHRLADEREGLLCPNSTSATERDRSDSSGAGDTQVLEGSSSGPVRRTGGHGFRRSGYHPYAVQLPHAHVLHGAKSTILCKSFTATGIRSDYDSWALFRVWILIHTGHCARPACPYMHDSEKVALCKHMLFKAHCNDGDYCDLSHRPTVNNTPHCLYYLKGRCNRTPCAFAHADVHLTAPVCEAFGRIGYCEDGALCSNLHSYECPDFANKGSCPAGDGCTLKHVRCASRMRKTHSTPATNSVEETSSPGTLRDDTDPVDENHAFTQQDDYLPFLE